MDVKTIGVIGAGTMGRGIAYAAALGGYRTVLRDGMAEMLAKGTAWIAQAFDDGAKRSKLSADDAKAGLARIETASSVEDVSREADFLIEAVPDYMDLTPELFSSFYLFATLKI